MASDHVFVSMTGTQVLGVLQPLMVLARNEGPLDIRLLHTAHTLPEALRIRDFCARRGLGEVTLSEVSTELGAENSAPRKVREIAQSLAERGARPCFNIDGGMNFMLAGCALALAPFRPRLIQTTRERALIYDTADDSCLVQRLPEPLSVEEILDLQKVEYTAGAKNPDTCEKEPLDTLMMKHRVKRPACCLENVEVSGIVFDHVWNPGNNRLCFFKDWRFPIKDSNRRLERERDFAQWSKNRRRCGQIYDKHTYALVQENKSRQRLDQASGGQIEVLDLNARYADDNGREICAGEKLAKIFSARLHKVRERLLEKPRASELPPMRDGTLVVCVGTNLIPTLVAICSHKARHLVLCYNLQDKRVRDYARGIAEYREELGLESVTLAKYPLEGVFPGQYLPAAEPGARVAVNITPGTKGQTCMLSLWAAEHGYDIWSLYNKERVCKPISASGSPEDIPMEICDPLLVFRIMGINVLENSTTEADLAPDFPWLDALLEFMRRLARAGKDFAPWERRCTLGNDVLKYRHDHRWRLKLDGETYDFLKEIKGVWYEKLCARALMHAGADKVRLNLGIRWDNDTETALKKKYDEVKHLLELDVVGACHGDLVLISCKAKVLQEDDAEIKESLDYVAAEAANTAAHLGRFALCMVSDLGASKCMIDRGVTILGWRDICEPEKLREHIASLRRRAGTSAGEA